jgi:hypothetical protein
VKLIRPRPDDFFLCQMYLFDREEWCEHVLAGSTPALRKLLLYANEARVRRAIQYYESFGFQFEPPDFWITRGQIAHLVDSGAWVPLGEFSGYPPNVSTAAC